MTRLMRPFRIFMIVLFVTSLYAIGQGDPNIARVRDLLMQIEDETPNAYRDPGSYVEAGREHNSPATIELEQVLLTDWRPLLQQLPQLAPTESLQTIFFVHARALPASDYIQFLNLSADMIQKHLIQNRLLLQWDLMPPEKNLQVLVIDDYTNPSVRALLLKYRAIFSNDPAAVKFVDSVLSGQAKKEFHEELEDWNRLRPQTLNSTSSSPVGGRASQASVGMPIAVTQPELSKSQSGRSRQWHRCSASARW